MLILPAMDLIGGRCVRLRHGDYSQVTTYDADPVETALAFTEAGATWLHMVDLDGARAGKPLNLETVARVARVTPLRIELGGGLRDSDSVARAFDAGVARVVIGTAAVRSEPFARESFALGERCVLGLDLREGRVATAGWLATEPLDGVEFARRMVALGCRRVIVTDIATDGAYTGPNLSLVEQIMGLGVPVIASGGVAGLEDVHALARLRPEGVIVGRALYEGRLDLAGAIRMGKDLGSGEPSL